VNDHAVTVRAGWAADGTIRDTMSPSLRARLAAADVEDVRRLSVTRGSVGRPPWNPMSGR
jgi:hypothetical protein